MANGPTIPLGRMSILRIRLPMRFGRIPMIDDRGDSGHTELSLLMHDPACVRNFRHVDRVASLCAGDECRAGG